MWYALPKRAPGRCSPPSPDDTTLSLPQAPLPDTYRGLYREDHPNPAGAYASEVQRVVNSVQEKGRKVTRVHSPQKWNSKHRGPERS